MTDTIMAMDGLALFSVGFGGLAIIFGLILLMLPIKFLKKYELRGYSAKLVGILHILGGILSAGSATMSSVFVSYILMFVGIALVIASWRIAYELRDPIDKRKSKPKHQKRKFNL